MSSPQYLISIDLGTSHTLLAYQSLQESHALQESQAQLFPIPQTIAVNQTQPLFSLPSLRYQLDANEVAQSMQTLPFAVDASLGEDSLLQKVLWGPLAEQRGAQTEGHLIHSAKSWLSQTHLNPQQAILPIGAAPGVSQLSAVDASASYLLYLRAAWNHQYPQAPLEQQKIVITVPASFDDAARLFTQQAAVRAGLTQVEFLEEPQAAFYDWYARHPADLAQQLADIDVVLVCDIGGGTSDFSLIKVHKHSNDLSAAVIQLERIAVSPHLLLGGDNIDALIAERLWSRLQAQNHSNAENKPAKRLSKSREQQWRLVCRQAKERLLMDETLTDISVSLLGMGTRMVADSLTTSLSRSDLMNWIEQGFFPSTAPLSVATPDSAVSEWGLHYATDPAITRHLLLFLQQHHVSASTRLGLLCNGGVLTGCALQQLLIQALRSYMHTEIKLLDNPHPQHAVALGGITYLRAQQTGTTPIRAAVPRNYFLQITSSKQNLVLCVLSKGTQLGETVTVPEHSLLLRVGEPVRFALMMDAGIDPVAVGSVRPLLLKDYQQLPSLQLPLKTQHLAGDRRVYLQASANALGNLQLTCVSVDASAEQWLLVFDLKSAVAPTLSLAAPVQHLLNACFANKMTHSQQPPIKTLNKDLEKLGGSREQWPVEQLRGLADSLLSCAKARRRSAEHERAWWYWLGFGLRPGFGFVQDADRIEKLTGLFSAGVQYQRDAMVWREWWLAWRRVSGGLSSSHQQLLWQMHQSKSSPESLECCASLERLDLDAKQVIAQQIWQQLQQAPKVTALWWALGRIGSQSTLYASDADVLPVDLIESWLQNLLDRDWHQQPILGFTAAQLAKNGVKAELCERVQQHLTLSKCPVSWSRWLSGEDNHNQQIEKNRWGDNLPIGLRLDDNK